MKTRLLFVYPVGCLDYQQGPTSFPIQLLKIASFLRQKYPKEYFPIIDTGWQFGFPLSLAGEEEVHGIFLDKVASLLSVETVVGFSAVSVADVIHALPYARELKQRYGTKVILGGYMAHVCADYIIEHFHDHFDAVIRGPGELACAAILDQMSQKGEIDLFSVPGATFRNRGKTISLPPAPPPEKDIFLDYSCLPQASEYSFLLYATSQGCPWRCQFCVERLVHSHFSRVPIEVVEQDIRNFATLPGAGRRLMLCEADFAIHKEHFFSVNSVLKNLGMKSLYMTRTDILSAEDIYQTADSTASIFFGVESPSETMLRRIGKTQKPSEYIEAAYRLIKACFDCGIISIFGLMPGYPGIKREEFDKFYEFVDKLTELHHHAPSSPGFTIGSHNCFLLTHGADQWHYVEQYQQEGAEMVSSFPAIYHGIEVPNDWQYEVTRPSREVSRQDVLTFFNYATKASQESLGVASLRELNLFGSALNIFDLKSMNLLPESVYTSESHEVVRLQEVIRLLHASDLFAKLGEYGHRDVL